MDLWLQLQEQAKAAHASGDLDTAGRLFRESAEACSQLDPADPRRHDGTTTAAVFFQAVAEDYSQAESLFRSGLESLRAQLGPGQEVANYMLSIVDCLRNLGREREAAELERESLQMWPGEGN